MSQLFRVEQSEKTSDDYLTPRWVFDALDLTFDLDVAAPPWETHVPAVRKYTKADDGLTAPWEGRVWMNPPFSKAAPWVFRFIEHGYGVALLPWSKSLWTKSVWDVAEGLALPMLGKQNHFYWDGGREMPYPLYLAAFGDECVAALSNLGRVR